MDLKELYALMERFEKSGLLRAHLQETARR